MIWDDNRWFRAVLAGALLIVGACGGDASTRNVAEPQIETVDVAPALTVPTEADVQAKKERVEALTGVLPKNFPSDLVLPIPASLIDFGDRYVVVQSPRARAEVLAELRQTLRQKGWNLEGQGLDWRLGKNGRQVGLRFEKRNEITILRYDY